MELGFDTMLCSNFGNENSDAGHIKCSRGPHLPAGRRFPSSGVASIEPWHNPPITE